MKITSVRVKKIEKEGSRLRGIASVVLDEAFVINGIRIIEDDDHMFISMPSRKKANGEHTDIAHPINRETRTLFEEAIFEAYKTAEVDEYKNNDEENN